MMIVLYQLLIFAIIILSGLLGGKAALGFAVVGSIVWTLTHIFWIPLMILQFGTIFVGSIIGFPLALARDYIDKD